MADRTTIFCWEVDKWTEQPEPSYADPVLLRRINDQFFELLAQWDLTDLERELFTSLDTGGQ